MIKATKVNKGNRERKVHLVSQVHIRIKCTHIVYNLLILIGGNISGERSHDRDILNWNQCLYKIKDSKDYGAVAVTNHCTIINENEN